MYVWSSMIAAKKTLKMTPPTEETPLLPQTIATTGSSKEDETKAYASTPSNPQSEFDKLRYLEKDENAFLIEKLGLEPHEKELLAYASSKFHIRKKQGKKMLKTGMWVYAVASISGAITPVLIGLEGDVARKSEQWAFAIHISSIVLSLVALVLNHLDKIYLWRERGLNFHANGEELRYLFNNFCGLSDEMYKSDQPHKGENFRIFFREYNKMLESGKRNVGLATNHEIGEENS